MRRIYGWLTGATLLAILIARTVFATGVLNVLLGIGSGTYNGSLTAGTNVSSGTGAIGYIQGSIGSLSTANVGPGLTITTYADFYTSGAFTETVLQVGGFSANPSYRWLNSVTFNSAIRTQGTSQYSYSAGVATWTWTSSAVGFVATNVYPGSASFNPGSQLITLSTTLTAGTNVSGGYGLNGYESGVIGSLSVSTISGYTIGEITDVVSAGVVTGSGVYISGFASNPGSSWLNSVTFNGHTYPTSSAMYSYGSGTATWTWSTSTGFGFASPNAYPGTLTY